CAMRACSRCRLSREGTRGGARLRRPTGAYAGAVSTAHGPELGRDQPGGPAGSPGRPADPAPGQASPAAGPDPADGQAVPAAVAPAPTRERGAQHTARSSGDTCRGAQPAPQADRPTRQPGRPILPTVPTLPTVRPVRPPTSAAGSPRPPPPPRPGRGPAPARA